MSWNLETQGRYRRSSRKNTIPMKKTRCGKTPKEQFYPFVARYMARNRWCARGAPLKRYLEKVMRLTDADMAPVRSKLDNTSHSINCEKNFHKTVNNLFSELKSIGFVVGCGNKDEGWVLTRPGIEFMSHQAAIRKKRK